MDCTFLSVCLARGGFISAFLCWNIQRKSLSFFYFHFFCKQKCFSFKGATKLALSCYFSINTELLFCVKTSAICSNDVHTLKQKSVTRLGRVFRCGKMVKTQDTYISL